MQANNLYKNLSKENTSTMIFHLFNRHDHMASLYRRMAADLEGNKHKHLNTWFSSLADFRQSLAEELRLLVKDLGSVPVKPSQEMKPFLHDREDEITRLINEKNDVGLIELGLQAEEDVAKYYQLVEANKDMPLPIREQLEKQHRRLSKVIRKAERLRTVPEPRKADFTI